MSEDVKQLADIAAEEPAVKYSRMQSYYPKERKAMVNAPGLIAIAGDRGYFPGCRLIQFRTLAGPAGMDADNLATLAAKLGVDTTQSKFTWPSAAAQINAMWECFGNLAIVDWRIHDDDISVMVTTQLEQEDLQDMQFSAEVLERAMGERRKARADAKAAEAKAKADEAEAEQELLALGRKVKQNDLLGRLRELEEKNADLQRRLKLAQKGK